MLRIGVLYVKYGGRRPPMPPPPLSRWRMKRRRLGRVNMLAADAEAEQARRDALQHRENFQQLEDGRRLRSLIGLEHAADDLLLRRQLQPLGEAHRERAA